MADRYWVGGTATWDTTAGTKWSTTSGGTGGASVPTASDNVIFDQSTTYIVTLSGIVTCLNFTVSAGNVTFSGTGTPTISGSISLAAGTTTWSATGTITFNAATFQTVLTNGTLFNSSIAFNGIGGTWQLQDALTIGSTRTTTLTNGTLDLNGKTLSTGIYSSSNTNVRTLNFNGGDINITGVSTTVYFTNIVTGYTILPAIESGLPRTVRLTANATTGTRTTGTGGTVLDWYVTSGIDNVAIASARNIDFTGFSGIFNNNSRNISGNFTLSNSMTLASGTSSTNFISSIGGFYTITTNGRLLDFPITFNGAGATWQLQDALTIGSTRITTLTNGILNLNGKTLVTGSFVTGSGTKNLTFNGGILSISGATTTAFNNAAPTDFTTTAGTSSGTISMTAETGKTFVGRGSTYAATLNQGGAGTLTITGANTFEGISNTYQGASTIIFPAGVTTTFTGSLSLKGSTSGNVTLDSNTGTTSATLVKVNGIADCDYLNYKNTLVTGGYWYAGVNSIDNGNNVGWTQRSAAPHKAGFWPLFNDIVAIF